MALTIVPLRVVAQSQQPSAPPIDPAASAPPPDSAKRENPGLMNEIGKLFDKPASLLPTLKSPQETIDDLGAKTKDAADGLARLTRSPIVTGKMACDNAANGSPDCQAASDRLCQSKGFASGKSLGADAAEKCSAKVLIPGRARQPGDCRTESYVTRAMCQ